MLRDILRWARVTKSSSDNQQFPAQQVEYLNKVSDSIMLFPYGIHGNVPPDSLALMFSVQGNPDNRAAIAWTPKKRPKLAEGETAFYHPPTDAFIIWRTDGSLEIETGDLGTAEINITAQNTNLVGNLNIVGNVSITGNLSVTSTSGAPVTINANIEFVGTMTSNGKDISDTHGHAQAADSGGNSEANISGVL